MRITVVQRIAKNGAFCYYSRKEDRDLQYYKADDVRIIILAEKFLSSLKVRNKLKLQINTLGNPKSRKKYITELQRFLKN